MATGDLSQLPQDLELRGIQPREVIPMAGDVSPRRYYRLILPEGGTAVLAVYSRGIRDACRRFRETTRILEEVGVRVPALVDHDCQQGWMLLEDVGSETLFDRRHQSWDRLLPHIRRGMELLPRIAALPRERLAALNPPLDEALLVRELRQTWEVYLEPRGLVGDPAFAATLWETLERNCATLASFTPVPCHRDFMARNLVPLADARGLAVLDHQDLRLGPPGYDLASLLNDSLFPPPEVEGPLLAAALPTGDSQVAYQRAAVQRTLKAVGTFALFARQGAPRHLPLIPPTLKRTVDQLAKLPEGVTLAAKLRRLWASVLSSPEATAGEVC